MTKRVEVTTELTAEALHEKYHKAKYPVERTYIAAIALVLLWGKKFDGHVNDVIFELLASLLLRLLDIVLLW
jgi:hypothetical protein